MIVLKSIRFNHPNLSQQPMFKFFKKSNPIEKFWSWYEFQADEFKDFQKAPDFYLREIIKQIRKISPGLAVELEPPQEGLIKMTISADGDVELFPTVQEIVAQAPDIPGWQFIAFRQRAPLEKLESLKLKGPEEDLQLKDMRFFPIVEGEHLDVIIYVSGLNPYNEQSLGYACLLLADNILGEYDCVHKVRGYDFHAMPEDPEELKGLKPLVDLAAYVDAFHERNNPS